MLIPLGALAKRDALSSLAASEAKRSSQGKRPAPLTPPSSLQTTRGAATRCSSPPASGQPNSCEAARPCRVSKQNAEDASKFPSLKAAPQQSSSAVAVTKSQTLPAPAAPKDKLKLNIAERKLRQAHELMEKVLAHMVSPAAHLTLTDRIVLAGSNFTQESMRIIQDDSKNFTSMTSFMTHLESRLEWLLTEVSELDDRLTRNMERLEEAEKEARQNADEMQILAVRLELQQAAHDASLREWMAERQQLLRTISKLEVDVKALEERLLVRRGHHRPMLRSTPDKFSVMPWTPVYQPSDFLTLTTVDTPAEDLHIECHAKMQHLREENAAMKKKLDEVIIKVMYGKSEEVEVPEEYLEWKDSLDAVAKAKDEGRFWEVQYKKLQQDATVRMGELKTHYEGELRERLKDSGEAWREKAEALKQCQEENKALLVRYKAMEVLVANTLSRLDRLQKLTLNSPSALQLLDKLRNAQASVLQQEDPGSQVHSSNPSPRGDYSWRSLFNLDGEEGPLHNAVLDAIDSSPEIKKLLSPEFYANLQEEIRREKRAISSAHSRNTSAGHRGDSSVSHRCRSPLSSSQTRSSPPGAKKPRSAGRGTSEVDAEFGSTKHTDKFPVMETCGDVQFPWPSPCSPAENAEGPTSSCVRQHEVSDIDDAAVQTDPVGLLWQSPSSFECVDKMVLQFKLANAANEVSNLRKSVLALSKQLAMFPFLIGPFSFKEQYDAKCTEVDNLYHLIDHLREAIVANEKGEEIVTEKEWTGENAASVELSEDHAAPV